VYKIHYTDPAGNVCVDDIIASGDQNAVDEYNKIRKANPDCRDWELLKFIGTRKPIKLAAHA